MGEASGFWFGGSTMVASDALLEPATGLNVVVLLIGMGGKKGALIYTSCCIIRANRYSIEENSCVDPLGTFRSR